MAYKILDLIPVRITRDISSAIEDREKLFSDIKEMTNGSFVVEYRGIEHGTPSIESFYDENMNAPYIIEAAVKAQQDGYNGIVIDCFGDPAIEALREKLRVPVIGANIAGITTARLLADKIVIINILPETRPQIEKIIRKYGFQNFIASFKTINVPVLEIEKSKEEITNSIYEAVVEGLEDGGEAVVFGCTGLSFLKKSLEEKLAKKGYQIPVIEPLRAAIGMMISVLIQGLSHSKLSYPFPREKPII
jgi:allantoin racemase